MARLLHILTLCGLIAVGQGAAAFDIVSTISPSITANDVEVLIWVKDGVTPEDEARVLADIEEGLSWWESVPTSHLSFDIVNIVHSATEPTRLLWSCPGFVDG